MTTRKLRGWRRLAERHARLGLLAADARYKGGDLDARTTREDFRAALDAVRTSPRPGRPSRRPPKDGNA